MHCAACIRPWGKGARRTCFLLKVCQFANIVNRLFSIWAFCSLLTGVPTLMLSVACSVIPCNEDDDFRYFFLVPATDNSQLYVNMLKHQQNYILGFEDASAAHCHCVPV